MTTTKRTGSRGALPPDALRNCPYCGTRRGTRKTGWAPAIVGGQVQGYTCPDCPTWDEPIRREQTGERVRFLAVIRWSSGGKVSQLKRRFDVLADARAWVAEQRENIRANGAQGGYVDASRLTVDELAERWLAHRRAEVGTVGGIREVTLNDYASSLFSLRQVLGSKIAREVTTDDVEAALRTLATSGCPDGKGKTKGGGLSHRTLSYALGTLRQVFDYAVRRRWLLSNPATAAKPPMRSTVQPVSRGAKRWTASELVQLRSHVDQLAQDGAFAAEPWIPVGMRLTLCGLRRSEVLGLDWSNVDLDAGTVKITASRVKTGRGHGTALGQPKKANSYRTVQLRPSTPGPGLPSWPSGSSRDALSVAWSSSATIGSPCSQTPTHGGSIAWCSRPACPSWPQSTTCATAWPPRSRPLACRITKRPRCSATMWTPTGGSTWSPTTTGPPRLPPRRGSSSRYDQSLQPTEQGPAPQHLRGRGLHSQQDSSKRQG